MLLSGCNRDIREFGKPTITHQITAKANPVFYGPPAPMKTEGEEQAAPVETVTKPLAGNQKLTSEEQTKHDIQLVLQTAEAGIRALREVNYKDQSYLGYKNIELFTPSFQEAEIIPSASRNKVIVRGNKIIRSISQVTVHQDTISYSNEDITLNAAFVEEGEELGKLFKNEVIITMYFKKVKEDWFIGRMEVIRSEPIRN